jgi:carbohydrate kinase (thermoresistant glucokinase family)
MAHVPGLRSPYAKIGRLVFFGRMLDKIRLHAEGKLPLEYQSNLGDSQEGMFDTRCCHFLRVPYANLRQWALEGTDDEAILGWAEQKGGRRTDEECEVWNGFMMKRGWHDPAANLKHLRRRIAEAGLEAQPIQTYFDFIDFDEGRNPVASRAWELHPARAILVMGVAGSGKTTIGVKLAQVLGWPFRDADDFHPAANVAKMAAGIPLDDENRAPWLAAIHRYLENHLVRGENVIVTCSALREKYRRILCPDAARVKFVYLKGDFALIQERLNRRRGHFMKAPMLESQFEALEPPQDAITIDIALTPDAIVAQIRQELGL